MDKQSIEGIGFTAGKWPMEQDRKTVIFIHGAGQTSVFWKSQLSGLSGRFNTVAIDLPGHGASGAVGFETIKDYASALLKFVKDLGIEKPAVCGLSMGGAIVQQLLIEHGEKFSAGIIMCSGAKLKVMPVIFETIEKDYLSFVDMTSKFSISKKTAMEKVQFAFDDIAGCSPKITFGDFTACNNFNVIDSVGKIQIPVLVMTGSEDMLTPPKYGTFLTENIPGAKCVNINDSGHFLPAEKPEEVNEAIREFLNN